MKTSSASTRLILLEPNSSWSRSSAAANLFATDQKHTVEDMKERLRSIRQKSLENVHEWVEELIGNLGCSVHYARTAQDAADRIKTIAGTCDKLSVNNSHSVLEIESRLIEAGLRLEHSYQDQYIGLTELDAPKRHFWDIPEFDRAMAMAAFCNAKIAGAAKEPQASEDVSNAKSSENYPYKVSLVGANAAAKTGEILFLQHSRNIGKLLTLSEQLIVLLPINRIAENYDDALWQVKCVGAFGLIGQLLGLPINVAPVTAGAGAQDIAISMLGGAPKNIHIVLLDNGRSRVLNTEHRSILQCIGCRSCLSHCPNADKFPPEGRGYPGNFTWNMLCGHAGSLDHCIQCGSCESQCPVGIDIPKINMQIKSDNRPNLWEGRTAFLMGNFSALMTMIRPVAPLANGMLGLTPVKIATEAVVGLARERQLPTIQTRTFSTWFKKQPLRTTGKKILYYPGCTVNFNDPPIGEATLRLLMKSGHQVQIPHHECCGMPRMVTGDLAGAQRAAAKLVESLYPYVAENYEVVTSCPSCAMSLRREIPWLLHDKRAEAISGVTHNLSHYLWDRQGECGLEFKPNTTELHVAYHTPCHLRDQNDSGQAMQLMGLIPSIKVTPIYRGCCGMSGSFGMKKKNYKNSIDIGSHTTERIKELKPDLVATDCSLCAMQLRDGMANSELKVSVVHPARLLSEYMLE